MSRKTWFLVLVVLAVLAILPTAPLITVQREEVLMEMWRSPFVWINRTTGSGKILDNYISVVFITNATIIYKQSAFYYLTGLGYYQREIRDIHDGGYALCPVGTSIQPIGYTPVGTMLVPTFYVPIEVCYASGGIRTTPLDGDQLVANWTRWYETQTPPP